MIKAEPQQQVSSMITVDVDSQALHCPKCLGPLVPPVFQCAAGHVVCPPCHGDLPDKGKCESCFVKTGYGYSRCFAPTKYTRCLAVERILRSIRVACPNAGANGCSAKSMPYHEKAGHDKKCPGNGIREPSILEMGPCGGAVS
ncbi:putative E3 ubiquitin-protein ligase SINA-like 9 [Brachypodium distachyon]|uniref:putative E3 ubiquitin-protein ligase SINA-like 9 n=1 Tax=Brachypodium distachyon TaxID=15368 RepID=UPI000D0DDDBA|nr:putative E3 ubiquitin-protein ligase SINA-like 9 [Brachypodium distachyon]|eukprot:XP_024315781.1 putative E3 ubiquitin-protein ligase SINA-like 9 [Brachypodium distachyon]